MQEVSTDQRKETVMLRMYWNVASVNRLENETVMLRKYWNVASVKGQEK